VAAGSRRSYASSSRCDAAFEEAVEVAGDVASQAALDLSAGLSLCGAAGYVVAGGLLVLDPALHHGVQRVVEVPVAVAVESIAGGDLSNVRRDRCDAGEHRERGLGVDAAGWDQAHSTVAATIGPTPNSSSRSGRQSRMIARIAFCSSRASFNIACARRASVRSATTVPVVSTSHDE